MRIGLAHHARVGDTNIRCRKLASNSARGEASSRLGRMAITRVERVAWAMSLDYAADPGGLAAAK